MTIDPKTGKTILYICPCCGNETRGLINGMCQKCHDSVTIPHGKFVDRGRGVTPKQLWSIIRGRRTNFRCANASWTYYPEGDPAGSMLYDERINQPIQYHPPGTADAQGVPRAEE